MSTSYTNHGEILTEVRKYTSTPSLYDLVLMSISEYSVHSHSSTGNPTQATGRWSPVFLSLELKSLNSHLEKFSVVHSDRLKHVNLNP
jgi:hypothetical protein